MRERAKAPSSSEEGVGGGGVSPETLRQRSRAMRNNPTEPEKRLWQALKGSQVEGLKFRRQSVVGHRIVDFYCRARKLAVEVDGATHDREEDAVRDARLLADRGIATLRFTNEDVMRNLDGVLTAIGEALRQPNHPPTPSLAKEGEI
jgi:very-short-patch-repair endonuclease